MITSKVIIDDAKILIKHESCSGPSWCRNKEIFIESNSAEKNTLSTIKFDDYLDIYIFWESFTSATSVEVLYVPETGVMFIGAGTVSARISTKDSSLLDSDDVCLFWGFDRHKEKYVLETGELECFLYNLEGKKISTAVVDPPYETKILEKGINFESIVSGSTWLLYEENV